MNDINVQNGYGALLNELKTRIHAAQYAALRAVNKELIGLYRDIGQLIEARQESEGWGKSVVERLSANLRQEFGEKSGFSASNLWYMKIFIFNTKCCKLCSHWLQKLPGPKTP